MLKLHPLSRRQAGLRLLLALGLLSGGLVHALQAGNSPADELEVKVDLKIDWRDSNNARKTANVSLADKLGKTMRVSLNRDAADQGGPETAAVELTVTVLGDQRLRIDTRLLHGSPPQEFAKPRMIVENGHRARIETGNKAEGKFLAMEIVATLLQPAPAVN